MPLISFTELKLFKIVFFFKMGISTIMFSIGLLSMILIYSEGPAEILKLKNQKLPPRK